jgi:hypothetical protein
MNPGYFSDAAVRDLLAVKTGEIDFLKKQVESLMDKCNSLTAELGKRDSVECTCSKIL